MKDNSDSEFCNVCHLSDLHAYINSFAVLVSPQLDTGIKIVSNSSKDAPFNASHPGVYEDR